MQRFIILLVLLCFSAQISAQYKNEKVRFTVMSDAHLGWLYSENSDHKSGALRFGGSGELHIDYFFRPQSALSLGVLMNGTGGNMQYNEAYVMAFQSGLDTLAPGTTITYKLRYVEIPFGLKLCTREIGYMTYYIDTGINFMFLTQPLASTSDEEYLNVRIDKEVSRFNLAYHLDIGTYYSLGNRTALVFSISYKNTFLDLTSDYLSKPPENTRLNHVAIKVGFAF
ncbi:MAG: outer membrane beta-barrel protein [Bacteroidetes bacterium]|jgi:hypothetical protein|nr:outer membrane beta-barrel protein [Bacteroidota bacterium]MBT7941519.1 outer membrane beta-barrel protein [Candidatus Neomarinimicrobiota bacterium]MBT3751436.1 outer membrane beta-barrel protein [Bacteroidota bacterium]MBT4401278.1 outer membrane beta-barrel protein [Bacteroidota bacterium]MBT4411600.1 outer membrane beta-barrel protein [Bacteroidota bacterium]